MTYLYSRELSIDVQGEDAKISPVVISLESINKTDYSIRFESFGFCGINVMLIDEHGQQVYHERYASYIYRDTLEKVIEEDVTFWLEVHNQNIQVDLEIFRIAIAYCVDNTLIFLHSYHGCESFPKIIKFQ